MSNVKGNTASATQVQDVYNALAGLLSAHTAWTNVDNPVIGSSDFHVWKSDGAVNSWGSDFYVIFELPTSGTGDLKIRVCEQYAASVMTYPCWGTLAGGYVWLAKQGGAHQLTANNGAAPNSYGIDSTNGAVSLATIRCDDASLCEYFLFVRKSTIVIATKRHLAGTLDGVHLGLYEPLDATREAFPLYMYGIMGTNTGRGQSRMYVHPDFEAYWNGNFSTYFGNFYGGLKGDTWTRDDHGLSLYQVMSANAGSRYDPVFGGVVGHRQLLGITEGIAYSGGGNQGGGAMWGLAQGLILLPTNTGTVEIGDEIAVNGETFMFIGGAAPNTVWVSKVDDT